MTDDQPVRVTLRLSQSIVDEYQLDPLVLARWILRQTRRQWIPGDAARTYLTMVLGRARPAGFAATVSQADLGRVLRALLAVQAERDAARRRKHAHARSTVEAI